MFSRSPANGQNYLPLTLSTVRLNPSPDAARSFFKPAKNGAVPIPYFACVSRRTIAIVDMMLEEIFDFPETIGSVFPAGFRTVEYPNFIFQFGFHGLFNRSSPR